MNRGILQTPLGTAIIEGDEKGISSLFLSDEKPTDQNPPDELAEAIQQLKEYFKGQRKEFDLKLNPSGTTFQKQVWKSLQKIPFGKTCSYLQLARELGDPKAVRAVAAANGKNPLWILVPCHRIIGSDGSLTGYAGGLWRKKWLLEHEQLSVQQTLF